MKKIFTILTVLLVLTVSAQSPLPGYLNGRIMASDSSYEFYFPFAPAHRASMKAKDSTSISFRFRDIIGDSLNKRRNDGTPTSILWADDKGVFKRSPITSLPSGAVPTITSVNAGTITSSSSSFTITQKRSQTLAITTGTNGVATFTWSSYSVIPNIQAMLSYPSSNKETVIFNAAPTTTGCSFLVQLRSDILGILPSYAPVNGREVKIIVTEE